MRSWSPLFGLFKRTVDLDIILKEDNSQPHRSHVVDFF